MKRLFFLIFVLLLASNSFAAQADVKLVDNNGRAALYGSAFTTAVIRLPSGPDDTKPIQIATATTKACTMIIAPVLPYPQTNSAIYIGGSNAATSTGFMLQTEGYLYLNLTNPSTLYARGSAYTPSISYILITE